MTHLLLAAVLLLVSAFPGHGRQSAADGCGLPAKIQGIDVAAVCSRLGIRSRSIYGPDRSPWIAIDNAGDCDRVRAEINRILSSPSQETVPPEPPPEEGITQDAATSSDLEAAYHRIDHQAYDLAVRGDPAASAKLLEDAVPLVKRVHGPNHWLVASYLNLIALRYQKAGLEAAAESFYQRAVTAAEKSGNPKDISTYRGNLARFYKMREADRLQREETQRKQEAEQRARDIEQLRSQLKPIETDGQGDGYGLEAEFKPLGPDYPAPGTAWEQALCAAYLSDMARQANSAEDARFYAEQAASVIAGGRIHVKWIPPRLTPTQERKIEEMGRKVAGNQQELHALAPRTAQAGEQARTAEIRKNEVAQKRDASKRKVETARQAAREAPPERKPELDDLLALAEQELQVAEAQLGAAERELNAAKQQEQDLSKQQQELKEEIRRLEEQMRQEAEKT
ncbi:MAG: tetratricopeptide repeat protein [Acidobacteriota bacterium]|jgi:hypothetical protein|nr:tetratricopeptide repeat protein [Acidobacteriota bacterium]